MSPRQLPLHLGLAAYGRTTSAPRATGFTRLAAVLCALSAQVLTLHAAQTNTTATGTSAKFAVAPLFVAPAVPQSEFLQPKKPAQGRDPFFPKSTRIFESDQPVKNTAPPPPVAELDLKGISGTKEQPLAIINTTTFTTGEENDVMTKAGRMKIRCLEINMATGTVTVQVGGERRELRLARLK